MNNNTNSPTGGNSDPCGKNSNRDILETAKLLGQFRQALIYLKLCSSGLNSVPAFNGQINSDQGIAALIDAFFAILYKEMPAHLAEYGDLAALEDALENAEDILLKLASKKRR